MTEQDEEKRLRDPSISLWLKDQINDSKERDVVDALQDAEVLVDILRSRLSRMVDPQGDAAELRHVISQLCNEGPFLKIEQPNHESRLASKPPTENIVIARDKIYGGTDMDEQS